MLLPFSANAIVEMESIHLGKSDEGMSGRFEVSAFSSSGNTEKEEVSLGAKVQWQEELHIVYGVVDYSYGQDQGDTNINKGFFHLRYIYQFHNDFTSEIFLQTEKDEFRRLTYRRLAGVGLRYSIFEREDKGAIYFGAGLFYEKEQLIQDQKYTDENNVETGSANLYLILKYKLSDSTSLVSSTYYQPNLRYSVDYRASENASLVIAINKALALKLSAIATHDSQPPQGVEQTDITYKTSIVYQF